MKQIALAVVLSAITGAASADAYLCIPEAAATVVDRNGDEMEASGVDISTRFILSNEGGAWILKTHPSGRILFNNCPSAYLCDAGEVFGGGFFRDRERNGDSQRSVFTAFWLTRSGSYSYANSAKGYCTSL